MGGSLSKEDEEKFQRYKNAVLKIKYVHHTYYKQHKGDKVDLLLLKKMRASNWSVPIIKEFGFDNETFKAVDTRARELLEQYTKVEPELVAANKYMDTLWDSIKKKNMDPKTPGSKGRRPQNSNSGSSDGAQNKTTRNLRASRQADLLMIIDTLKAELTPNLLSVLDVDIDDPLDSRKYLAAIGARQIQILASCSAFPASSIGWHTFLEKLKKCDKYREPGEPVLIEQLQELVEYLPVRSRHAEKTELSALAKEVRDQPLGADDNRHHMYWYGECDGRRMIENYDAKGEDVPPFLSHGCQHPLIFYPYAPHWNCCGSHDPFTHTCRGNVPESREHLISMFVDIHAQNEQNSSDSDSDTDVREHSRHSTHGDGDDEMFDNPKGTGDDTGLSGFPGDQSFNGAGPTKAANIPVDSSYAKMAPRDRLTRRLSKMSIMNW